MEDFSYLGTGIAYVREVGAARPMVALGNASDISFGVTEDVKTLADRTAPGGGTRNEVRRIQSVDFTATLTDYSPDNLALGFFGTLSTLAAGNSADEPIVAYRGGLNPLKHFADSIASVKSADGTVTFDPMDANGVGDYALQDGGLYVPAGSAITDAQSIKVTSAYGAKSVMEALTRSAGVYEFYFPGFNEARQSKRMVIRAYRVRLGATDKLALITDDFGNLTIKGTVLKDLTKPVGTPQSPLSQYFKAESDT